MFAPSVSPESVAAFYRGSGYDARIDRRVNYEAGQDGRTVAKGHRWVVLVSIPGHIHHLKAVFNGVWTLENWAGWPVSPDRSLKVLQREKHRWHGKP